MKHIPRFGAAGIFTVLALLCAGPLSAYAAATAPGLGAAANFVVLGGAGVTCTGSTVAGNVGSKLTVTQTGCNITGAIHQGDTTAVNAFNNFVTAYNTLKGEGCSPANHLTGQELAGKTLGPGVYCFATTADLTSGTLTLKGPSSGVWVFQVGTGITTDTANVVMDGGSPCNVYWALGTTATIGKNTNFQGNILAGTAVTFTGANSSLVGRALAKTAVTMTGTTISGCTGTVVKPPKHHQGKGKDHHGHHHRDGKHHGRW